MRLPPNPWHLILWLPALLYWSTSRLQVCKNNCHCHRHEELHRFSRGMRMCVCVQANFLAQGKAASCLKIVPGPGRLDTDWHQRY